MKHRKFNVIGVRVIPQLADFFENVFEFSFRSHENNSMMRIYIHQSEIFNHLYSKPFSSK